MHFKFNIHSPSPYLTSPQTVFTTWFNDCFVLEVEKHMTEIGLPFKVLLIVDNAPGHPCLKNPNIKVVFLPLNTTSLIQLLDQGIIATFKKHFVKLTFRCILENDAITLTEVWKKFLILDCINHAATAIAEIKRHTLNACWKAAWLHECNLKHLNVIIKNRCVSTWHQRRFQYFQ